MKIIQVLSILVLLSISYQDLKSRQIYWLHFPLLAGLLIFDNIMINRWSFAIVEVSKNIAFVGVQLFLLGLYLTIKDSKVSFDFSKKLGLGDIMLFFAISPGFSTVNFIVVFVLGLIFSLFTWIFLHPHISGNKILIPLCGLMSVFVSMVMLIDILAPSLDKYKDIFITTLL